MKVPIVILPFKNLSPEGQQEYFADGLTEEIIYALGKIDELKVISRTSSFYFKDKNLPISEIADQLGVEVVLEGSVRIHKEEVRISTQLIKVQDDVPFWSESWDRKMDNIFELQDEISLLIAERLREHIGHFEISDHLIDPPAENITAYEWYLKGKYHFKQWNPKDVKQSISCYEKAVSLDPNHIESYLGLGDSYSFLATTQFGPREESWERSVFYTQKAQQLDPNHPGVNYQMAQMAFFTNANFGQAASYALKAITSRPTFIEAQQFMAFLYILRGEMEKARKHLQLALGTDPLNQETRFYEGYFHYRNGDFYEAIDTFHGLMDANPNNLPAFVTLCYVLMINGESNKVIEMIESIGKDLLIPDERLGLLTLANTFNEDKEAIASLLYELENQALEDSSFQAHSYLFLAFTNLNRVDDAFDWLKEAMDKKSSILLLTFSDPLAKNLRSDPRYLEWHKKIYPAIPTLSKKESTKKTLLDEKKADQYHRVLVEFVDEEMPFLNPQLTLRSLADQVRIHANQLSWLLNKKIGKNFNEYINLHRLEHFKQLVKDPANSHISLLGLAYESGFNSKTVFNTFFKKQEGMTPKQYHTSLP